MTCSSGRSTTRSSPAREDRGLQSPGAVLARRRRGARGAARRGARRARPSRHARHGAVQVVPGDARPEPGLPLAARRPRGAGRVRSSLGLEAEVVLPPPQHLDFRCEAYEDFVLSVGRLDRAKRVDLLLEALAAEPGLNAVIAGDGPDRARLEELARRYGLD